MDKLAPLSHQAHDAIHIINTANLADGTKQKYRRVVLRFLDDGGRFTNPNQLASFAATLPASGRAHLKAAIRLWSNVMIDRVKGSATPENIATVQATIYRFEALQTAVSAPTPSGEKAHIWLSRDEVTQLMDMPTGNKTLVQRDRLALALLVGAGLRRNEAVTLTFADVKMQPVNGRFRTVLNITGKGAKKRIVPISDKLARMIDTWGLSVGSTGRVLRSIGKGGKIRASLSAAGLFEIVRGNGRSLSLHTLDSRRADQLYDLAPHDLRRTYAQIGYESGVPITQISKLLGHASVSTTQRYLNLDLDLETTISDFVPV